MTNGEFFPTCPRIPRSSHVRPPWYLSDGSLYFNAGPLAFRYTITHLFPGTEVPDPEAAFVQGDARTADLPAKPIDREYMFSDTPKTFQCDFTLRRPESVAVKQFEFPFWNPILWSGQLRTNVAVYVYIAGQAEEPEPDPNDFPDPRPWRAGWFGQLFGFVLDRACWVAQFPFNGADPVVFTCTWTLAAIDDERDTHSV